MIKAVWQWMRGWWLTFAVLRDADPETRRILTQKGFDEDDFVEGERP